MQAFHNDQKVKDFYLGRVEAHREADEIIQGFYWENGKGCAIGCTIHGDDHSAYERELGIPMWLAKVEDKIFEGLLKKEAKEWPVQFLEAIPVGVDLNQIKIPFLIFVVESTMNTFDHQKFSRVKKSIDDVLAALKSGEKLVSYDTCAASASASWADAAAYADAASASASYASASASYAASAASYAASAAYDTYVAAAYATACAYAADAGGEARRNANSKFAKKLIELIKDAK